MDERLRGFLESDDWLVVRQGVELGMALGDPGVFAVLARGIGLDEQGALLPTDEWANAHRIRASIGENLALLLLSLATPSPLEAIEALDLSGCQALTDLDPLRVATRLRRLKLDGCRALKDGAPLASLPELRSLSAVDCGIGAALPPGGLPALETLALGIDDARTAEPLAHSRRLRRLTLRRAHNLADLEPLRNLAELQYLRLEGCASADLEPLGALTSLQELVLDGMPDGTDPSPISRLASLRRLTVGCWSGLDLAKLLPEGSLPALEALDLDGTCGDGLTGFAHVRGAPALVEFCSPNSLRQADGTDLRDLVGILLPSMRHQSQEGADAAMLLGATMVAEAATAASRVPGQWPAVRAALTAALRRAGPGLAAAALGNTITTKGLLRTTTSSPIRRICERTGGDWLEEAVRLLADAAGMRGPGTSEGER